MALVDLWKSDRSQITGKRLQQLIAFAGEGALRDGNETSQELRELLAVVSSDLLGRWIEECLNDRFTDFGFVLQDIVNEIGRRLGFTVTYGVYRGRTGNGYDGLWQIPGGKAILVESKSSTTYTINLSHVARYRDEVSSDREVPRDNISILIVVGQEDTEDLESQVRGSRYAWDVRLLGVHSLHRLLRLKETLDDPGVERQIQEMLTPQEFTRLDGIIDLVFATAEDAQTGDRAAEETDLEAEAAETTPSRADFHAAIVPQLETHLRTPLVKRSRVLWSAPDDAILVSCQVSKEYQRGDTHYWFGLKRSTKEKLEAHLNAFCAFGLGSTERVLVIPYRELGAALPHLYTSPEANGEEVRHWHVRFLRVNERVELILTPSGQNRDVSEFVLAKHGGSVPPFPSEQPR